MPQANARRRIGLRTALMLSAGAMLVAVLVAFEVPLSITLRHHALDEARAQELADASRLATRISDAVALASGATPEVAQSGVTIADEAGHTVATSGLRVLVVDPSRRVLYDSRRRLAPGTTAPDPTGDFARALTRSSRFTSESVINRDGSLFLTLPVFEAGRAVGAVQVERPLSSVQRSTRRTDLVLVGLALLALLVGLAVAAYLAALLTRPVQRLEHVAVRLGTGDLAARADEAGTRELASLAESFNSMAADLGSNIQAQQEFAANASHQLKTPLTALQLRLEAIASGPATGVDTTAEAQHALDDVGRLIRLMNDLLALAQVSAPVRGGEPVDLGELATTVVDHWAETASRHDVHLTLAIRETATVIADPHDLEDLLDNLLDNAIRYGGAPGRISVSVTGSTLAVENDGPEIAPEDRQQIFERFFRGRNGRSVSPGTGLGLAIVDALARRWGARVSLVAGRSTRFEVRFPEPPRS